MPLITRTERTEANAGLGISNPVVAYNASNSQHQSWSPVTMLVYHKWAGGAACLVDRSQTSTVNGLRFNISGATGNHWFSARSSSGSLPAKYADSPNTPGEWRHIAAVWTGSHTASSITLYHADDGESITPSGVSSETAGSSSQLYPFSELTNRGLRLYNQSITDASDWPTRSDVAYVAVWKRALTQEELETARATGPLNVSLEDLVLLRANGTDLSGYDATTFTEPAFPDGDLPPILTLGGASPLTIAPIARSITPASIELPDAELTIAGISRLCTPASIALPTITVDDAFERSCVDVSLTTITPDFIGDGQPFINMQVRRQTVSTMGTNRWLEPVARISGVNGVRPWVGFKPFGLSAGDGRNHQTWYSTQRAHYSYDGIDWLPFLSPTLSSDTLRFRPSAAFTEDVVFVARSWPRSVTQVGNQIAVLAAAHPTKIHPSPAALAFTPTLTTGFPAQAFIADEASAKTDELSRAVPATPLYGFEINDSAYSGEKKLAFINGGVHSGEDIGEVVMWELIDFLMGVSDAAVAVRQQFRIIVHPLVNPAGRYAGYWRGAPGSNEDPNREWLTASPTHDCVAKVKAMILAAASGQLTRFAFDFHSTPRGDGTMHLGVNNDRPSRVAFDSYCRAAYPAGSWHDYADRTVSAGDPATSVTTLGFYSRDLVADLSMLVETSESYGPVNPTVARPYAEAMVVALADMAEAGWFGTDETAAGEVAALSLSAPAGTAAASTSASGTPQTLSLSAPAGDATTASTTFASGSLAALSLTAPNGTSTAQAAVSAGIQALSLTAPAGDASSTSTTFASGDVAPVSLAAPAGTTAQSTASSGAIQHISLTAQNGNASTGADMVASGDIAPIGIFTASGASVVAASASGAIRHLTISALMGAANDGSAPAFDLRGSVFARIPARHDAFARIAARSDVFARIQ